MPALWEKPQMLKTSDDLTKVDLKAVNISGPTVIYISGRDQVDGSPEEISKNIYFANKLVSDLPDPPQVYLWSHSNIYAKVPGFKDLSSMFHVAAYSHFTDIHFPAAKKLAKNIIMPLVTDAEGKKLEDFEQAKKNLRNLTILGYCLGSITAQETYNASLKMMRKAGYEEEKARELLREAVLISFATFSRPEQEKDRFTTLNFVNSDDLFVGIKNLVTHPLFTLIKLGKIFSTASRKLNIKRLSDTNVLVSAAAREKPLPTLLGEKQHEVIEDVTLRRWKPVTNHEAKDYVNDEETKNQLARMVKIAIRNAVTRTGTLSSSLELLQEPSISEETPEEHEQYNRKIVGGLIRGARPSKWKRLFKF